MNEAKVYADDYQKSFASLKEMIEFLRRRTEASMWLRTPAKSLRLIPINRDGGMLERPDEDNWEDILADTENNTQLLLKVKGDVYPVRQCAINTILKRAGISGNGLRKLEKPVYAKVINYCLKAAKGDALIKVADGKVSAAHAGDDNDYCILDIQAIFETACEYLATNFKGSSYIAGSGSYDQSIVSAMWELGGNQEMLDIYREALRDHGIEEKAVTPALRLTTSDVAASGANLYPMLLCDSGSRTISLGSPIKLTHERGADLLRFRKNLEMVCARYTSTIADLTKLLDIEIRNPVNCMRLMMKQAGIRHGLINEVVELFAAQYGEGPCSAHDLYFAMNEASFFAACSGMAARDILKVEEDLGKLILLDWEKFDVCGAIKL